MVRHMNMTYSDAYKMAVWQRRWFINRFIEENEKKKQDT